MQEFDMFGVDITTQHASALAKTWDYPPFSVLSARDGWWQERKRAWLALGIQSELGRSAELIPNGGGNGSKARYGNQPPPHGQADGGNICERARAANMAAPGGDAMPACNYSNRERGDGRGRPIK